MRGKAMLAGLAGLMLLGGHARAADAGCDRTCLDGFVDQYLAALVAHDPHRLPLTADARFTENGQTLKLGDALWGTADGLGTYRVDFDDPEQGEVGAFAVVDESHRPAILAVRLKVVDHKISEIETVIARKGAERLGSPEDLKDNPAFTQTLAAPARRTREELIRIANSYADGLEQATGKITPFDPGCTRVENGVVTANNPNAPNPIGKLSCGGQFDTGFSKFITKVRERRFPVVDLERGLVYGVWFFDHNGTVKDVTLADGTNLHVPPPFDTPFTLMIAELFKIDNGKIKQIEAVLLPVPYGMPSGWGQPH